MQAFPQRGQGGDNEAPELQFEDLVEGAPDIVGIEHAEVLDPVASFVVAMRWLLRAIEVSAIELARVKVDLEEGIAVLFLPTSKADTSGLRTSRRLRCTRAGPKKIDMITCPAHVLDKHLRKRMGASSIATLGDERAWAIPLFPTVGGEALRRPA